MTSTVAERRDTDERPGESRSDRLDREIIELLNELRVVLTGVQVLFAFLLTVPFTDRFGTLGSTDRLVFAIAFIATAAASVLLIAPTTYHRIRFRQRDKEQMLRWANRFAISGSVLLAVAIGTIVLLVMDVLYVSELAAVTAASLMAIIVWSWFGLPLTRRAEDERSDDARSG
jgi:uncharacterized membrane protein